jgi:GTP-binding protein YchF
MSSISCGIIGLPNVGKSTLFNALTKSSVLAANYPFATIEPNVGMAIVPDPRLQKLAELYGSNSIVPATVRFVDIAGLVSGASKGEGLGNQFLSHIRNVSAIVEVVRSFSDSSVTHVNSSINPKRDIDIILTELELADLETVNRRLDYLEKEVKANPKLAPKLESVKQAAQLLEEGKPVYPSLGNQTINQLGDLQLLTAKPIVYVFNVDEDSLKDQTELKHLSDLVHPAAALFIPAKLESELSNLEDYDAKELRESYGFHQSGLESLVVSTYQTLGLQSFLTAGQKEVRAWTIKQGSSASEAAGVIHGDMQRGFIAAEVVSYNDLVKTGSLTACRAQGKVRTEGKDYIMQPDDVVEFKFNV